MSRSFKKDPYQFKQCQGCSACDDTLKLKQLETELIEQVEEGQTPLDPEHNGPMYCSYDEREPDQLDNEEDYEAYLNYSGSPTLKVKLFEVAKVK